MEDLKAEIFEAIEKCSKGINEKDLPALQKEYIELIEHYLKNNNSKVFSEIILKKEVRSRYVGDFFSKGHQEKLPPRIIIIGDIHCDLIALREIFYKLGSSNYNYFNHAIFIFLGDYLDRGSSPLETLRMILHFKKILKERCILLRGNHESIVYNEKDKSFRSLVSPAETIVLFSKYLETDTLMKIKDLYEHLPFFILLKYPDVKKKYMLVHGGIPCSKSLKDYKPEDIEKHTLPLKNITEEDKKMKIFLNSLMWGDPRDVDYKMDSGSLRFEFGRNQFTEFAEHFGITNLVRGHEPNNHGFKAMYDEKLFTVFSSGGSGNEDSGYSDSVENPAFCIIDENGEIKAEQIFTYRIDFNINEDNKKNASINYSLIKDENLQPYLFLLTTQKKTGDNDKRISETIFTNPEFKISVSLSEMPLSFKSKASNLFNIILKSINHVNTAEKS